MSALRPVSPRAPERDLVGVDPTDDFVEFWRAGASATGWFCCVECGAGVATAHRLPTCAACGGELWERAETSPFGLEPPLLTLDDDDPFGTGAARAIVLSAAAGAIMWLALAAVALALYDWIAG